MVMLVKYLKVANIVTTFENARLSYIITAFLLVIPNVYIQFYKWRYLLKLIKKDIQNREAFFSLLVGFTFGFITPGRVGEFGRAFFIKNCPWMKVIGISFIDKFFALSIVLFMGAIGILSLSGSQLHIYILLPLILFTIIAMLLLRYILIHPELIRSLLYKINIILPIRDKIKQLIHVFDNFNHGNALRLLSYSFIFYFIFFTQFFLLVSAFEGTSIIKAFQAISSTLLVKSMLPISLGDLGIRESAAIFFLGKIGVAKATAFNASILIFIINILIPSMIGFIIVLKNKLINIYDYNQS